MPARAERDPDPDMGQTRGRELEKEKAERLRRYHALRELLTTEVGYLLDLRALVTVRVLHNHRVSDIAHPSLDRSISTSFSFSRLHLRRPQRQWCRRCRLLPLHPLFAWGCRLPHHGHCQASLDSRYPRSFLAHDHPSYSRRPFPRLRRAPLSGSRVPSQTAAVHKTANGSRPARRVRQESANAREKTQIAFLLHHLGYGEDAC